MIQIPETVINLFSSYSTWYYSYDYMKQDRSIRLGASITGWQRLPQDSHLNNCSNFSMKFGNCGHTGKLAEFINLVRIAQRIDDAQLHFIVEYDPYTKEKFKLRHEDLQNLHYTNSEIFLDGKMLASWWDIDSAAIIVPL